MITRINVDSCPSQVKIIPDQKSVFFEEFPNPTRHDPVLKVGHHREVGLPEPLLIKPDVSVQFPGTEWRKSLDVSGEAELEDFRFGPDLVDLRRFPELSERTASETF